MASVETGTADAGVWLTIAELARRKGVSKQAATKRVNRLVEDGKLIVRAEGRNRLVELATYDRLVGQVGDGFKEQAAATVREMRAAKTLNTPSDDETPGSASARLRDNQEKKSAYDAMMRALDYAERVGQVIPLTGEHGLEGGLIKVSNQILRDLNTPTQWIDEIMEACRKGEPNLRRLVRTKVSDMRRIVAGHLLELADVAMKAEAKGIQIDIHVEDDE